MLHHFQMSRAESKGLKDIEERLLAIREENKRIQREPILNEASTTINLKILHVSGYKKFRHGWIRGIA